MKLFVVRKNSIFFYAILFAVALTVVLVNRGDATFVFNNNSEINSLPIYSVDKGEEKTCAISFDAAWGNEDTDELIKILEEYNVKTTFFVVGSWADKYPESVKALFDAGHEIMNHSDSHPHMTQLSSRAMKEEIEKCDSKIESITGEKPFLFRPPYGDYNAQVIETLENCGHYTIQWSVDSLDWKDLSADEIYKRVTEKIHPGAIVLFHNAAKNTPEALPMILNYLKENDYKVVPISDIIYKDNYKIDHTGKQIPKKAENIKPEAENNKE